jgi:hypothetical protein
MSQLSRSPLNFLRTFAVLGLSMGMVSFFYNFQCWSVEKRGFAPTFTFSTTDSRSKFESMAHPTTSYRHSSMEIYVRDHSHLLGFDEVDAEKADSAQNQSGCEMWKDSSRTDIYDDLTLFRQELHDYERLVREFKFNRTVQDVRYHMKEDNDKSICDSLQLHPQGLTGIFTSPSSLSHVPNGGGYVEPLLPPLRHPDFCFDKRALMNLGYCVHDFAELCHHRISPHGRTVFIDMGASLDFHAEIQSPAIYVIKIFEKFGILFDHIYGYEVNQKNPTQVYQKIPTSLKHAYHWYNVGVNPDIDSAHNPLTTVLSHFSPDDFVVVKLDVDTSSVEVPMVQLILDNENIASRIDVFFFEHHVMLSDLGPWWGTSRKGSVSESFDLFTQLRRRGIAAHYWP